jgi:hypothetical protein
MGSLIEIYKQLGANYTDTLKATQDAQANAIALQNARRAQQEREGLKALYANQTAPSYQQIGAFDPAMAQEYLKNQFLMQKDQIEMANKQKQTEQINFKMGKEQQDLMAKLAAATIDEYDRNIEAKMPQAQALDIYNRSSSRHLSENKQRGIIPPEYPSFDPESMNPEALRTVVKGQGFPTEKDIRTQEFYKSLQSASGTYAAGLGPQKPQFNPLTQDWEIPPASGLTNPPPNATPADPANIKKLTFYENMSKAPDATAEEQAFAEAQIKKLSPKENFNNQPSPQEALTPEQKRGMNVKQKGEIAAAEKAATLSAEDAAAWKQTFSAFKDMPPISTQYDEKGAKISEGIDDIISKSYNSKLDVRMANIASELGQHTNASVAEAKLQTIFAGLLATVKTMPGSQSNVELQQRQRQVGAVLDDPTASRESKREAFHAYLDAIQRQIINRLPYSENEIDDLVVKGIMSETAAAKYDKALAAHNKGMR